MGRGIMDYLIISICLGCALFLAVPGAILLSMGIRSVWRGLASAHWPTAPGVVLHAGMTEDQAKDARNRNTYNFYSADLAFRYRVNGRDYTSETVQFGQAIGTGDISNAAVLLLRYPAGAKVTVSYHPNDPALATVKPGVNTDVVWYFVGGVVLILFGAFVGVSYKFSEPDFPMGTYVTGFFCAFFILFGVGMLAPGLRNLWYARASLGWPTTQGVVVYSEEEPAGQVTHDGEGNAIARPQGAPLAYQYEVNGTQYCSNIRHFGQFIGSSSQDWAEEILWRYPSGSGVPVSYCPSDPDLAVLEPGINSESYYLPGAGLAFLLFAIAVLIWSILR